MRKNFVQFSVSVLIITLIIALVGAILFSTKLGVYYLPVFPLLLGFFALFSISVHYLLLWASKKNTSRFTNYFMLASTGKLLVYTGIIGLYSYLHRESAISFVVAFFFLYLVFTVYEVSEISRYQQKKQ